ncbi:MAG TPA: class I adenylate-forming enzyme family protein, partial [Chitinophagales bacterium]|nr:class I adenylate-forming enzyme family protein [Chitinophagales bacterium]
MINNYKHILQHASDTYPERIALIFKDNHISYFQLNNYAIQAANWFRNNIIVKCDRVAFLDFNNSNYVHLVNGCLISGIIPVSINWRSTVNEINFILKDAGCKLFLFGENFKKLILESADGINIELNSIESISNTIFRKQRIHFPKIDNVNQNDLALLIYTSGTTGQPKGVKMNYNNIYEIYLSLRNETPLFGPASVNLIAAPWYAIVG